MKKIIKISSLGLVTLLAGCGKIGGNTLKKISPDDAIAVVKSIYQNRLIKRIQFFDKNPEEVDNPLFSGKQCRFPLTATKISADIEINSLFESNEKNARGSYLYPERYNSTSINKHLFIDIDNCYAHSQYQINVETDNPEQSSYPTTDLYYFFIEDEEQPKIVDELGNERERTKYEKIGTIYTLMNFNKIAKIVYSKEESEPGDIEFTRVDFFDSIIYQFMNDQMPIVDLSSTLQGGRLNIDYIIKSGFTGVTYNWTIMNSILQEVMPDEDPFPPLQDSVTMNSWFSKTAMNFTSLISGFEAFRTAMLDLKEDGSYFDYTLRSNDAASLGVETDVRKAHKTTTESSITKTGHSKQTSSIIFKNLYLTESSFEMETEGESVIDETKESLGTTKFNVSCSQTIKYNPSEKDTIPADYKDYTPLYN